MRSQGEDLDWQAATLEFDRLVSLSPEDRNVTLAAITQTHPELATFLRTLFHRVPDGSGSSQEATQSAAPGQRIGPWLVEDALGAGGMGEVFQVRRDDGVYDQTAALKLIRTPGEQAATRFAAERQRLARLEHPGIARIIDGGEDALGRPYMAMEFVDGAKIDRWCEQRAASFKERIALLRQLCTALAHAHARLVLHRDIKPGNVLVTAAGQVRLIDFGIATLLDSDEAQGFSALTLATAAPEQLNGGLVSTATDIFQTGMLAHQLLTGSYPERQSDGSVAIERTKLADEDLAAILAKATASDPQARYESIDALGDDLANFVEGLPVEARAGGALYRARKFVMRNAVASGIAAVLFCGLVGATIASLVSAQRANAAREETEIYLAAAQESATQSRATQYLFELAYAAPEDQERLSQFMLDYAVELSADLEGVPDDMSALLAAIAIHFNRAGQCQEVLQVTQAWLASDFGFPADRADGQGIAGNCLMQQGRYKEAAQMLRSALDWERDNIVGVDMRMETGVALQRIALSTRDPADIAAFEAALPVLKEAQKDTGFLSYIAMMEADLAGRVRGFGGAQQEFAELGSMAEDVNQWLPGFYQPGLARVAEYAAAIEANSARAHELIATVEGLIGDSEAPAMRSRLLALQGGLSLEQGDFAQAATQFAQARALREGLFGEASYPVHHMALLEAYALIRAGQVPAATALRQSLQADVLARDERTAGFTAFLDARLAGDANAPLAADGESWPCKDPAILLAAIAEQGRDEAVARYCEA